MGTSMTCVGKGGMDDMCSGRGFPEFVAPNTEHVTYVFDFRATPGEMKLQNATEAPLEPSGLPLRGGESGRGTPKWQTVKECAFIAAHMRLNLSGRFLVLLAEPAGPEAPPALETEPVRSMCIFKVCTRGVPIFESLRTRSFTHTAHMVTSGVFFALFIERLPEGVYYLCPRVMLVLKSGDEVSLVEDRLGPLRLPQAFYADFAVLDDGGRNVQMDLIVRVLPTPHQASGNGGGDSINGIRGTAPEGGLKTLRTCLQEYTTFNCEVPAPAVALGATELRTLLAAGSVHLQNLVLSEAPFAGAPTTTKGKLVTPSSAAAAAPASSASGGGSPGGSAAGKEASAMTNGASVAGEAPGGWAFAHPSAAALEACRETAVVLFDGPARLGASSPPDLDPAAATAAAVEELARAGPAGGDGDVAGGDGALQRRACAGQASVSKAGHTPPSLAEPSDPFWYHVRYGVDPVRERDRNGRSHLDGDHAVGPLRGEFWITQEPVDKKHVYFHCSSTLAQAITMCIVFRFSCPTDYLSLIENQAATLLRNLHIPTNGAVFGVEEDPRHRSLYRIFVEHRNEILDDMVVCESTPAELSRIVAHQEVYDAGDTISYRLTLVHPDGARQEAVLQLAADRLEVDDHFPEETSLRFPISSCVSRQLLSPANRIFVYTSVESEDPSAACEAHAALSNEDLDFQTPSMGIREPRAEAWGNASDGTVEDWQSAGGGVSDGEDQASNSCKAQRSLPINALSRQSVQTAWQRPLVDSAQLLAKVEEPPFRCTPGTMAS